MNKYIRPPDKFIRIALIANEDDISPDIELGGKFFKVVSL